jgi:hypothetical protein
MKRKKGLITAAAALLSGLLLAEQSTAQTPRPTITPPAFPPPGSNLIDWVHGEVRLRRGSGNWSDSLTCGPASSNSSYWYGGLATEIVVLKFRFTRVSSPPLGSWAVRRIPVRGTLTGNSIIFAGQFSAGSIARGHLPGRTETFRLFNLSGTTHGDGRCFNASEEKEVKISGNCDRPGDGINFQVFTRDRVYARGTFSGVVAVTCGTGPERVDLSLDH